MANFASIEGTVTDFSTIGAIFSIRFTNTTRGIDEVLSFQCVATRSAAGQYTQGIDSVDQTNYMESAMTNDLFGTPSLSSYIFSIPNANTFKAEATEYGWEITEESNGLETRVTFVETPEVLPAKNFQLTSFSFAAVGASQCGYVFVSLTQNGDGVAPFTWVQPPNQSGSQTFDLDTTIARSATVQTTSIIIEDSEGDQASIGNVVIPPIFEASYIEDVSVVTNQSGLDASVTVFMNTASGNLSYEYSIDGSNFQTSNVFTSLADGNYTLYVKDQYDCIKQQAFTVDVSQSFSKPDPIIVIPTANSIRFRPTGTFKYQTLANTNYQNEYFYGEWKKNWAQIYQTNDGLITTQFRTNYSGISAQLFKDGVSEATYTINQVSDNQGLFDSRDCIAYNYGNNQTAIYFTSGNTYDNTGAPIGTYALNGGLPEWGVVGNTIILSNGIAGSYVIKQVTRDDEVGAYILVIDYSYQATEQTIVIKADVTYDRKNYESYEFDFDTNIAEGIYQLAITFTDPADNYPAIGYTSEYICIKSQHTPSNFIEYSVSRYTGLDYSTGYQGRIRVISANPYHKIIPGSEDSIYTDSLVESTTLKAIAYLDARFYMQSLNRTMFEKVNLALTHEEFYLNGEKWTKQEGFEDEDNPSSLFNIFVTLRKNNYEEYGTNPFEIDEGGRIQVNNGYLLR